MIHYPRRGAPKPPVPGSEVRAQLIARGLLVPGMHDWAPPTLHEGPALRLDDAARRAVALELLGMRRAS